MREVGLGIGVACREAHRAALADQTGKVVWSNRRFTTTSGARLPLLHPDGLLTTPASGRRRRCAAWSGTGRAW